MGNDIQKGTTYSTGGAGGQGTITSANLNAHVDDAVIKSTFISAKADRPTLSLTDQFVVEAGGALYKAALPALYPTGAVVQVVYAEYTANSTNLTTTIPLDDTIPQSIEGTEVLTATITPKFVTSRILVRFSGQFSASAITICIAALFRDAIASAIAATAEAMETPNFLRHLSFEYLESPASTSALTYRMRVGPNSAVNMRMNGNSTSRLLGGVNRTTLTLEEIK
jgi:hypothetical protein